MIPMNMCYQHSSHFPKTLINFGLLAIMIYELAIAALSAVHQNIATLMAIQNS